MHGQALAISPQRSRLHLLDPSTGLSYADHEPVAPSRGIDLRALWLIVVRNRLMMLCIVLLALTAGVASIWLAKPI